MASDRLLSDRAPGEWSHCPAQGQRRAAVAGMKAKPDLHRLRRFTVLPRAVITFPGHFSEQELMKKKNTT
ncbi:hypothetical protein, partial [Escherichia coli]|uniref:hypothetical protein n=1 Tax=Escherichia coli TaxID=562 RepID=UPI001A912B02